MAIRYFAERVDFPDPERRISSNHIRELIMSEGLKPGEICIIFVNDEYLLEVNKQYLERDYFTDVIAFEYSDKGSVSGDIFISVERVSENADQLNVSFDDEIKRVIIHGLLHLCGYRDATDEERREIRTKEDYYLMYLGR